jgi:hypothetical protein
VRAEDGDVALAIHRDTDSAASYRLDSHQAATRRGRVTR